MPEICRSRSARSASVRSSRLPYLMGRCKGTSASLVQMPWRSGSPHGVFGAAPVFSEAVGALPIVAGFWHATVLVASETTTLIAAAPANRSRRCVIGCSREYTLGSSFLHYNSAKGGLPSENGDPDCCGSRAVRFAAPGRGCRHGG